MLCDAGDTNRILYPPTLLIHKTVFIHTLSLCRCYAWTISLLTFVSYHQYFLAYTSTITHHIFSIHCTVLRCRGGGRIHDDGRGSQRIRRLPRLPQRIDSRRAHQAHTTCRKRCGVVWCGDYIILILFAFVICIISDNLNGKAKPDRDNYHATIPSICRCIRVKFMKHTTLFLAYC